MNSDIPSFEKNKSVKTCWHMRIYKALYLIIADLVFLTYFNLTIARFGNTSHFNHPKALILFTFIYMFAHLWLIRVYNGFYFGFSRTSELAFSLSLSTSFVNFAMYILICIYLNRFMGFGYTLLLCLADILLNIIFAFGGQKLYFHFTAPRPTAIVYRNKHDLNKISEINSFSHYFNVVRLIENPKDSEALFSEIQDCEIVVVAGIKPHLRNGIIKYCLQHGILAYIEPKIGDVIMSGGKRVPSFSIPVLKISRAAVAPEFLFLKRIGDIFISLIAIIILSPLMLIAALLIKLGDGGPVFYKQTRLTKNGREFDILKFRSMRVDAEKDGVARLATENDDRITPVGRFLRATRMDELPQLFNVLKGEMSVVGPRPERPEIAKQYMKELSTFDLRLQVKAGITGYAQVYGKYNTEPYDKLQLDLMYINSMSIFSDLWIMFATLKVLFQKDSTAGIETGQHTAASSESRGDKAAVNIEEKETVSVE